jgi:exonuclease SbcD
VRILHFSDIHIGVENHGRPATEADIEALPPTFAPDTDRRSYLGLSTRLLDFLASFDELVDYATRERVDLVLFAGDAYKSRDPSQTHQREFARRVATLTSRGIPVFLLVGNHDIPHARGRASALEIFPTLRVPQVWVGDRLETHLVETRSGPLQVVALPWVRRGGILAAEAHQGKSVDELTRYIEEELTHRLMDEAERLDPSLPAVLCGHVTVAGATTSSERSMMLGRDYVLQHSSVALSAFDYVALGHIHKHQRLGESPPVVYPGSLQRIDFSEEDDLKGFCQVDLDPAKPQGLRASWEFIPQAARSFVTIHVTVSPESDDPTQEVLAAISRKHVAGAVVRLHITIPAELVKRLDERAMRGALADAHFIAPITREVLRDRRPRLGTAAKGITPEEALRWYLENRESLDPDARQRALERGIELIEAEKAGE